MTLIILELEKIAKTYFYFKLKKNDQSNVRINLFSYIIKGYHRSDNLVIFPCINFWRCLLAYRQKEAKVVGRNVVLSKSYDRVGIGFPGVRADDDLETNRRFAVPFSFGYFYG